MYAIIKAGGKQYKVAENDVIELNKLDANVGEQVVVDEVLLVCNDSGITIGAPFIDGAKVECKVLRQYKGRKINGYTYKPKKDSHRRYGHRQLLSSIKIEKISA